MVFHYYAGIFTVKHLTTVKISLLRIDKQNLRKKKSIHICCSHKSETRSKETYGVMPASAQEAPGGHKKMNS